MALAPVVAASLNAGLVANMYQITIDGLDVAGSLVNGYGVDPTSMTITEAGYGQVSSASFTITDQNRAISVAQGQRVRIGDLGFDMPLFLGWVSSFEVTSDGMGRSIQVTCIGIEALLDWTQGPAYVTDTTSDVHAVIQALAANAYSLGTPMNTASGAGISTIQQPVGINMGGPSYPAITVPAGSLRQQIVAFVESWVAQSPWLPTVVLGTTVDFWGGLRVFQVAQSFPTTGYAQMWDLIYLGFAINLTAGAAYPQPEGTVWQVGDATARNVVVTASGQATFVSDGSTIPGPTAILDNPSLTTDAARRSAGASYLANTGPGYSGTVSTTMTRAQAATYGIGNTTTHRSAGVPLNLTDPSAGVPGTVQVLTTQIVKQFYPGGAERWTISFGGNSNQTGSRLLRLLTSTRSV